MVEFLWVFVFYVICLVIVVGRLLVVTSVCVNFSFTAFFASSAIWKKFFIVLNCLTVIDRSKIQPFFIYAIVYCNYF